MTVGGVRVGAWCIFNAPYRHLKLRHSRKWKGPLFSAGLWVLGRKYFGSGEFDVDLVDGADGARLEFGGLAGDAGVGGEASNGG